jgi:uncharacterized protein (TIGR01777 family)
MQQTMTNLFERSSSVDCDQNCLFEYHANPGALNRLIPPWEKIAIEKRSDSLSVGSEVIIKNSLFGVPVRWHAKHTLLDPPKHFQDIQLSGPFHSWCHDHFFEPVSSTESILRDHIQFELKFGALGKVGMGIVRSKLQSMFEYRHHTTRSDIRLQQFLSTWTTNAPLRIGVTGSNGLIGRRLVDLISVLGHKAIRIVRPSSAVDVSDFPLSSEKVVWDSKSGFRETAMVENLDAVIHLAGKGIASSRWTDAAKQAIRSSRVEGTLALVRDLSSLSNPPKSLVCASGVGIYGSCEDRILNESSPTGTDFLSELARDWEQAAQEYEKTGNRVAIGRLGIALHPREGALAKLLTPFSLGVGGRVGSGRQYWGWIDVDDAAGAFLTLAIHPECRGPYNLVAPEQVDNQTFSRTLGRVLGRPSFLPVPAFALRLLLGSMADSMLLASTRASSDRLQKLGFPFRNPTLEASLRHVLGR